MTREKIELLQEELAGLQLATTYLEYSMQRCFNLTRYRRSSWVVLGVSGARS